MAALAAVTLDSLDKGRCQRSRVRVMWDVEVAQSGRRGSMAIELESLDEVREKAEVWSWLRRGLVSWPSTTQRRKAPGRSLGGPPNLGVLHRVPQGTR